MKKRKIHFIIFFSISLSLISCSSSYLNESAEQDIHSAFRIVYYIHGDGSYLYHDSTGNGIYADKYILNQAIEVAKKSKNSEVHIFHQDKPGKFLFIFPQKNSRYYFFKNGNLLSRQNILVNSEMEGFNYLSERLSLHKSIDNEAKNFFLYYGHTIPEITDTASDEEQFTINSFTGSLESSQLKYEMIILSTCSNGTPYSIMRLSALAKYIVASPADLHLSGISSLPLIKLDKSNYNLPQFALSFTAFAFKNMSSITNTMVVISLYNSLKVAQLFNKQNVSPSLDRTSIFIDCKDLISGFVNSEHAVKVFYRPPAFGRHTNKIEHSGWGCPEDLQAVQ